MAKDNNHRAILSLFEDFSESDSKEIDSLSDSKDVEIDSNEMDLVSLSLRYEYINVKYLFFKMC